MRKMQEKGFELSLCCLSGIWPCGNSAFSLAIGECTHSKLGDKASPDSSSRLRNLQRPVQCGEPWICDSSNNRQPPFFTSCHDIRLQGVSNLPSDVGAWGSAAIHPSLADSGRSPSNTPSMYRHIVWPQRSPSVHHREHGHQ